MEGKLFRSVSVNIFINSSPRIWKIFFSIRLFATVTTGQGALIIGGNDDSSVVATVACYNSGWSRLDDLQSVRHNNRAIVNGDKVYVIGGSGAK